MVIGFALAVRAVVANDAVSFFGPFLAANRSTPWPIMWLAASAVLLATLWTGWAMHGGDIAYGRLAAIPPIEVRWYHALAPLVLLGLTRFGIPASTSFLVLSTFAAGPVIEAMLIKSLAGYGIAAVAGYGVWSLARRWAGRVSVPPPGPWWRVGLWLATGLLWATWLSHDLANIAIYLERQVEPTTLALVSVVLVAGLAWTFQERGGRIQRVVSSKRNVGCIRSATVINVVYACVLLIFKELSDIPMSTSFVFVGLLAGRELALTGRSGEGWASVGRDAGLLVVGAAVSVGAVVAVR